MQYTQGCGLVHKTRGWWWVIIVLRHAHSQLAAIQGLYVEFYLDTRCAEGLGNV